MKRMRLKLTFFSLTVLISVLIGEISRRSFIDYEKRIISQQQEQLLTISRLVGRSILNFVEEKVKGINYLAESIKGDFLLGSSKKLLLERLVGFETIHGDQILSVQYLDFKTGEYLSHPMNVKNSINFRNELEFEKEMQNKKIMETAYIGNAYRAKETLYVFDIYKAIICQGNIIGVIVVKIDINNMYNLLVAPVKAGKYGYAMVKDSDGTIIMHPVIEQLGYNVLDDRKEKYPELDYTELEKLIEMQLSGKEGTYVYHSYWWPEEKLVKVKKFQGFSSINLTSKFWIVAVTMSYDEVKEAIKKYLFNISLTAITLISVISGALFLIIKMISNSEAHRVEMNYLKEINENSEKLRLKDNELLQEKKVETIGTLTGGIAHEFNNILTPIMGYSEMLLSELKPEDENYDEMKIINDSSKRASEVIDQILLFSRGKDVALRYEELNMKDIVENALRFFEAISSSNMKIVKKISGNSCNVFANETELHQIILNLCINAFNAIKKKGGKIEIALENIEYISDPRLKESSLTDKNYVKLSIIDDGEGMSKDALEKIFTEHEDDEVSSLLFIAKLVKKHGGRIFVESKSGIGTKFDVYFPLSEKRIESIDLVGDIELRGEERVLIVDSEGIIVDSIKNSLEELGYKLQIYPNGAEVLKRFNELKDRVDLVISDIKMPEVGGVQLAKKFKRNKKEIKFILMTANTEEPLEELKLNGVIDDYILKPLSAKKICKRIRAVRSK